MFGVDLVGTGFAQGSPLGGVGQPTAQRDYGVSVARPDSIWSLVWEGRRKDSVSHAVTSQLGNDQGLGIIGGIGAGLQKIAMRFGAQIFAVPLGIQHWPPARVMLQANCDHQPVTRPDTGGLFQPKLSQLAFAAAHVFTFH